MKFWEQNEYPQLAANEYFCLKVAKQSGLDVPTCRLAEDGLALVVDRLIYVQTGRMGASKTSVCSTLAALMKSIVAAMKPLS